MVVEAVEKKGKDYQVVVAVTGSEGMLGQDIMQALTKKGIRAEGIDIRAKNNSIDITNNDSIAHSIKRISPDILIHTAAYTDVDGCELNPDKAYSINREGTKNITKVCKDTPTFLIYISTDFVFDGEKRSHYTEDDEPNPINVYGKSKLEGENFIRANLKNYLIIRTSWLFGKGGKNFVDTIVAKANKTKRLKVVNDQSGSPTYTSDLAKVLADLLAKIDQLKGKIYNITNSGSCTWYEFAKEVLRFKAIDDVELAPIASDQIDRAATRPKMSILDNSKLIETIGKPLPGWQDALSRYLAAV